MTTKNVVLFICKLNLIQKPEKKRYERRILSLIAIKMRSRIQRRQWKALLRGFWRSSHLGWSSQLGKSLLQIQRWSRDDSWI